MNVLFTVCALMLVGLVLVLVGVYWLGSVPFASPGIVVALGCVLMLVGLFVEWFVLFR